MWIKSVLNFYRDKEQLEVLNSCLSCQMDRQTVQKLMIIKLIYKLESNEYSLKIDQVSENCKHTPTHRHERLVEVH